MRVMIALDDSQCSEHVIDAVVARPWCNDVQFAVINVVQIVSPDFHGTFLDELRKAQGIDRQQAVNIVAKAVARLTKRFPSAKIESFVENGVPWENIVEQGRKWNADLIMVGSHGRSRLQKFLLGSVAESVLHHSPCSVEIVRVPCRREPSVACGNRDQVSRSS